MQTVVCHADARADGRERARSDHLERRLDQYQPQVRARVRALAARHPHLRDLAGSFPALLFALAVPRPGLEVEAAIARVIDGASLRDIALLAGVPLWLRGVEPRALAAALPALPDGERFRRQIGNFIPAARAFQVWVQAVGDAYAWADQAVALWVARELRRRPKRVVLSRLRSVCVWAWYSRFAKGAGVYATPHSWTPAMAFEHALACVRGWLEHVELYMELSAGVADMWLKPGVVDGFEFVPLQTPADIAEEARVMKHCIVNYGGSVRRDTCRLWSVWRDGARVGTVEVGYPSNDPLPSVSEICGKSNEPVALAVWIAARRWLAAHDIVDRTCPDGVWNEFPRAAWIAQWRPYWLAKRQFPKWLPLSPSRDALDDLRLGARPRRRRRRRLPD